MKNLALTLATTLFLAACSSGSTVAPVASTVNSQFSGTFASQSNIQSGTVRLDISQTDTAVTGNLIITNNTNASCVGNGTVTGTSSGFNISLTSPQTRTRFQIVTTQVRVTGTDDAGNPTTTTTENTVFSDNGTEGTRESADADGNRTTIVTTRVDTTGNINIQLAISNNGNTISGTYVADAALCEGSISSGDLTLNRS